MPSLAEDLVSTDGTRYSNVKVSGETADAVKILHSSGIATIPKAKIPLAFLEAHELTVPPINTAEPVTSELDAALAKFKTTTPEFTARDGRKFKSSEITAIDPAGIKLMGASGILRLQFSELPPR